MVLDVHTRENVGDAFRTAVKVGRMREDRSNGERRKGSNCREERSSEVAASVRRRRRNPQWEVRDEGTRRWNLFPSSFLSYLLFDHVVVFFFLSRSLFSSSFPSSSPVVASSSVSGCILVTSPQRRMTPRVKSREFATERRRNVAPSAHIWITVESSGGKGMRRRKNM